MHSNSGHKSLNSGQAKPPAVSCLVVVLVRLPTTEALRCGDRGQRRVAANANSAARACHGPTRRPSDNGRPVSRPPARPSSFPKSASRGASTRQWISKTFGGTPTLTVRTRQTQLESSCRQDMGEALTCTTTRALRNSSPRPSHASPLSHQGGRAMSAECASCREKAGTRA